MSRSKPPSAEQPSEGALAPHERELLARAREQYQTGRAPEGVRERLLAHALDDARRGPVSSSVAAAPLRVVPVWSLRSSLWLASAAALAVVLLLQARELIRRWSDERWAQAELQRSSEAPAAGKRWLDSPLFQAPAGALPTDAVPPTGNDLFPEPPFSIRSAAWQVRRWDDLSVAPTEPAAHELTDGALCVPLGASRRVLGGWPWAPQGNDAPKGVPLEPGQRYRLIFEAWAREPLPAQLLVAVGHARLPFSASGGARVPVTTEPQTFVVEVSAKRGDPSVGVAFLATGARDAEPTQVCLRGVRLLAGGT